MNFQIEKYKDEFKDEILDVWSRSVLATHHFLSQKDFDEIRKILKIFDFSSLDTFCLTHNQIVIGFMALQNAKVEMLFISPKHFGKGLGRKMMNFATETLHASLVDVNEQNLNAVNFYKKAGFKVYDRTEKDDLGMDYPILKMKLT